MVSKPKRQRPKRPAIRLGEIYVPGLIDQLRELHKVGSDPRLERFPDNDDLLAVLDHAERMASSLTVPEGMDAKTVLGEAAVIRAKLWQHLRELADVGQLKAIQDGRAAKMPWESFNEALCVATSHGAQQKAQRLEAEQVRDPQERRSPSTAREHQLRKDREAAEERRRIAVALPRFLLAQRIARQLVEHRGDLILTEMGTYWLDEIAEIIDGRDSELEKSNFVQWIGSLVREFQSWSREHQGARPGTTDAANAAVALAVEFVQRDGTQG